ncbi:hypothetical protein Dsin_025932 [Dipteronia sinensis]|uniref:GED domain-containing protein n=1 Tax=Dipteronia sinensis TaxID=43782 RepID=A0AAD9ZX97_9ROSI|nr:hypothetical protein Dsin_025932 [Dipteronia sinensis]
MDKGTDAVEILEGRSYKLQYPWIGVVNRSQADINKSVDMIAARRREREYFQTTQEYSHLASRMGSEYLGKVLSKHLETVIKSRIPGLQSLINKTILDLEAEMSRIGKPVATDAGGKLYMIMEICRAFDQTFKEHLDGIRAGGDKIYGVFDNQLPAGLKRLQFDKHLSLDNVRKLITEADGYQPHLIAPEQGYRRLIDSCLVTIRGPAEAAVDAELKQYPSLRMEVGNAAVESLERMRDESKKATLLLVDMESGYLTVDFFRKLPQDVEKGGNPTHSLFDRYNDSYLRRIGSTVLSYVNMVCATLRHSIPKSVVYCQVREAKRSLLDHFFTELGAKEMKKLSALLDEDPAIMQRRTNLAKRLELYRSAQSEIEAVAWAKGMKRLANLKMDWNAASATDAYLDTLRLCSDYKRRCDSWRKTQEPGSNEFISALAAGMKAKLIVEVSSAVSPSTLALATAARHTGGRLVCILPEPILAESKKVIKDSGLKDMVEFKTGDPCELLSHYGDIDFSVIDCKNDDNTRLLSMLNVNPEKSVVVANNLVCEKKGLGGHVKGKKDRVQVRTMKHPIGKGMEITMISRRNEIENKRDHHGDDAMKRNGKSRWVVKVDEKSGEEHIFRVPKSHEISHALPF